MALSGQAKKDYMREYNKTYAPEWSAANREKRRAHSAKFQVVHSKEITAKRLEGRRTDPIKMAKAAEHGAKRRARLRAQLCDCCTRIDLFEFWVIANAKTTETGVPHEVDHIIPIAKGGAHCAKNLRVITMSENREKGAR